MIRDNIGQTAHTDKPPLTPAKVFAPKDPGYSPYSQVRPCHRKKIGYARHATL